MNKIILLTAMCFLLTSCFQMTRDNQSRITEESDQYRNRTWQVVAYNTVTKPDGSSLKTPVILTLSEVEEITYNKQTMEKTVADYRTKNPASGLGGLLGKAASAVGIPGASMIEKFLGGGSSSGGGLTGMGATNEFLAAGAMAWAAERRAASKRRAPVPPQPTPVEGRSTGNTGLREEES